MPAKAILLPNGRPAVRITHTVNGQLKRKCVSDPDTIPTREAAERLAAAINKALETGKFEWDGSAVRDRPAADWTFKRYAQYWLIDNEAAHKAATRKFYKTNLEQYLYPAMGPIRLGGIDRGLCKHVVKGLQKLRGTRTNEPLSLKTREGIWHTLQSVLTGAIDDEAIENNPAIRLGKYLGGDRRTLKKAIAPYTFEETDWFLQRCQRIAPEYYDFFFVGFRTGMREGELIELRWDEDFADHRPTQVHVQRNFSAAQYDEDRKRGVPPPEAGITTPKGGRDRYVDLSPQVIARLRSRRTAVREEAFAAGRPMPALVFTAPRGGRVNPRNLLRRIMPAICTRPVPDGPKPIRLITIHTIRHSFVTQMLLKHGIGQLPAISQQIGHRDVSTTERHYAHWITEHREVLAKRLDEPVAPVVSMWGGESGHE